MPREAPCSPPRATPPQALRATTGLVLVAWQLCAYPTPPKSPRPPVSSSPLPPARISSSEPLPLS